MGENVYCRYVEEPERATYDDAYYQKPSFQEESAPEYNVLFDKFPIEAPLLDYGCGTGVFLKAARDRGLAPDDLFGADTSPAGIEACRAKGFRDVTLIDPASPVLPFENAAFRTVITTQVLEHIPHARVPGVLDELVRVLAPGGVLLVFCPAEWSAEVNDDPTHITFLKVGWFRRHMIERRMHELAFDSLTLLPPAVRRFGAVSYVVAKALYKITMQRPTTIEYVGVKMPGG